MFALKMYLHIDFFYKTIAKCFACKTSNFCIAVNRFLNIFKTLFSLAVFDIDYIQFTRQTLSRKSHSLFRVKSRITILGCFEKGKRDLPLERLTHRR